MRVRHWTLSRVWWIQSAPSHSTSFILSSSLRLNLRSISSVDILRPKYWTYFSSHSNNNYFSSKTRCENWNTQNSFPKLCFVTSISFFLFVDDVNEIETYKSWRAPPFLIGLVYWRNENVTIILGQKKNESALVPLYLLRFRQTWIIQVEKAIAPVLLCWGRSSHFVSCRNTALQGLPTVWTHTPWNELIPSPPLWHQPHSWLFRPICFWHISFYIAGMVTSLGNSEAVQYRSKSKGEVVSCYGTYRTAKLGICEPLSF